MPFHAQGLQQMTCILPHASCCLLGQGLPPSLGSHGGPDMCCLPCAPCSSHVLLWLGLPQAVGWMGMGLKHLPSVYLLPFCAGVTCVILYACHIPAFCMAWMAFCSRTIATPVHYSYACHIATIPPAYMSICPLCSNIPAAAADHSILTAFNMYLSIASASSALHPPPACRET